MSLDSQELASRCSWSCRLLQPSPEDLLAAIVAEVNENSIGKN
jgi:hypothetical protein